MKNEHTETWTHRLREVMRLLASDSNTQLACFPFFTSACDEIASEFHEVMLALPTLLDAGVVSSMQEAELKKIDRILENHSTEGDSFWIADALSAHPDWQQIRTLSLASLDGLNVQMAKPHLDWPSFKKGPRRASS